MSIVSAIGRSPPNGVRWVFPGAFPDAPLAMPSTAGFGNTCTFTRAALASLEAELPAAVVAHLLDLNINTAIAWSTYAQPDWTAYLAARASTVKSSPAGNR